MASNQVLIQSQDPTAECSNNLRWLKSRRRDCLLCCEWLSGQEFEDVAAKKKNTMLLLLYVFSSGAQREVEGLSKFCGSFAPVCPSLFLKMCSTAFPMHEAAQMAQREVQLVSRKTFQDSRHPKKHRYQSKPERLVDQDRPEQSHSCEGWIQNQAPVLSLGCCHPAGP